MMDGLSHGTGRLTASAAGRGDGHPVARLVAPIVDYCRNTSDTRAEDLRSLKRDRALVRSAQHSYGASDTGA